MIKPLYMKKIIITLLLILPLLSMTKDKIIPYQKLPNNAKSFISSYFNHSKPLIITYEFNEYEVVFEDNSSLEFNNKGICTKIKSYNKPINQNLIPVNISSFINQNFKNNFITEIEFSLLIIEIKLDNNLEIKFDKNGNFLSYDN